MGGLLKFGGHDRLILVDHSTASLMKERASIIEVNRAPVMTLWVAIVAERIGYDEDAALTLGRAVAGVNAQSKGRRLGIFKPVEKPEEAKRRRRTEELRVKICGRAVPAVRTEQGVRSLAGDRIVKPESVRRYLESSFGDNLGAVKAAMKALAKKFTPEELSSACYGLYEQFRPTIPGGKKGWGASGRLDLRLIRSLGK
jgi:hypothetical protein